MPPDAMFAQLFALLCRCRADADAAPPPRRDTLPPCAMMSAHRCRPPPFILPPPIFDAAPPRRYCRFAIYAMTRRCLPAASSPAYAAASAFYAAMRTLILLLRRYAGILHTPRCAAEYDMPDAMPCAALRLAPYAARNAMPASAMLRSAQRRTQPRDARASAARAAGGMRHATRARCAAASSAYADASRCG